MHYLSTMMPALMALATLRNLGLSSPRRLMLLIDRVKVRASQSRTSLGTASGSTSDSSSSSSQRRLQVHGKHSVTKWQSFRILTTTSVDCVHQFLHRACVCVCVCVCVIITKEEVYNVYVHCIYVMLLK